MEAASAPLVTIADTAPIHTTRGVPNFAAMLAAVIWPTSPHSEKKIAAKDTSTARDAGYSFSRSCSFNSRLSGLRQRAYAMAKKLIVVIAATSRRGRVEIALPTI